MRAQRGEPLAARRHARGCAARVAPYARGRRSGGRWLPPLRDHSPRLTAPRRVIDEDMQRLTSAMADLEAEIEAPEKQRRRWGLGWNAPRRERRANLRA